MELNDVTGRGVAPHCGVVSGKLAALSQALPAGMNVHPLPGRVEEPGESGPQAKPDLMPGLPEP